ncbi:MAG: hypothetical protein Q7S86_03740 [bacterium]|nr:hypothetical protein [bacterium]
MKKQFFTSLVLAVVFIPQISFAAWWNPMTWFKKPVTSSVTKVVQVATTTPATKTSGVTTTSKTEKTKKIPSQPANPQSVKVQMKPPVAVVDETLTKEQIAIKMATDVEYANSPLDKATRQEIDKNWESIKKYYTGKRGKNTTEGVYQDILDAYYKWKGNTSPDTNLSSLSAKEHEELLRRDPVARAKFCVSISPTIEFNRCMDMYLPIEDKINLIFQQAKLRESISPERNQPVYIPQTSSNYSVILDDEVSKRIKQEDFNRSVCDKAGGSYSLDRCW